MKTKPKAWIMVGLPASGKSTWVEKNITTGTALISSDDIIEKAASASGLTYSEAFKDMIGRATHLMKTTLEHAVSSGEELVWDQTNLTKKKRKQIIEKLKDYEKIAVVFSIPEEIRKQRQQKRHSENGKDIPPEVIDNMIRTFELPTKDEGFDQIIMVKD